MSEAKKPTKPKAIADVAHPNKSAPSDTSKPIITHRPRMQDPMVVDEGIDKSEDTAKKQLAKKTASELKITPPSVPVPEDTKADTDEAEAEPAEKASEPKETDAKTPETEPAKDETPDSDESADADKKSKQPNLEAEAAAQVEQDAKIQKIIDSKKYFLPINAVEQRRSARFVLLGVILALVLAIAWVDVALDAGLIHLGSVKPVTHLFSN